MSAQDWRSPAIVGAAPLVIVRVTETIDPVLAGHAGCTYQSPPQSREQAAALVRVLLGRLEEPNDGCISWTCAIASSRRTVALVAVEANHANTNDTPGGHQP